MHKCSKCGKEIKDTDKWATPDMCGHCAWWAAKEQYYSGGYDDEDDEP